MSDSISIAKDVLSLANLIVIVLIIPLYRFMKNSIQTNIELANTIRDLREELELLRGILFDIADGEVIKKHLTSKGKKGGK